MVNSDAMMDSKFVQFESSNSCHCLHTGARNKKLQLTIPRMVFNTSSGKLDNDVMHAKWKENIAWCQDTMTQENPVALYLRERDYKGRTLLDIILMDDAGMERKHDYIQVLFPTTQRSRAVPNAPVLSLEMVNDILRNKPHVLMRIQEGLYLSFSRMLRFYGLAIEGGSTPMPFVMETSHVSRWRTPGDHNALRISRIITCLRLFDLNPLANAFKLYLQQSLPTHPSQQYW